MKKFILHFLCVCIFFACVLISLCGKSQDRVPQLRSQNEVYFYEDLKSKSGLISNTKTGNTLNTGKWIAETGTGFSFEFLVEKDAKSISQVKLIFNEWTCGSVKQGGSVTITSNWNIVNQQFTCNITIGFNPSKKYTITGKFSNQMSQASGDWTYESIYGNCSGTWTATPEGVKIELPDLVPISADFNPKEGGVNTDFIATVTVKNEGLGSADTCTMSYCLCIDLDDSSRDVLLGSAKVPQLNAGQESDVNFTWKVPGDLPVGDYNLGFTVDIFNSVKETDEGNIYYLPGIQFSRIPDPDLVINSLNFTPVNGGSNENLNVNIVLKNRGEGDADQSDVNYYLSEDDDLTEADFLIGSSTVANLKSGEEIKLAIDWSIQKQLNDGSYYVGCIADAKNQINESKESNNSFLNKSEQFKKDDPPYIKEFSPFGVQTATTDAKPELKIVFSEEIKEGQGCLRIFQKLSDGSEYQVLDKECWEGKITKDTLLFRLSNSLDSFATHFILIDEGFVKDQNGNLFPGLTEKSAWVFKTGDFTVGLTSNANLEKVKIYPNPTFGEISIELPDDHTPYTLEIMNLVGQSIIRKEFVFSVDKIDLQLLPKGNYVLRVYNKNLFKTEKIIVQ